MTRETNSTDSSGLISLACSILLGWNIALVVGLLTLVAAGVAIRQFGGPFELNSPSFVFTSIIALAVAAGSGVYAGLAARGWFAALRRTSRYIWLIVLLALSVLTFPGRFYYEIS
ncbi:MAG: hypothetical protein QNJ11_13895 [Woeseiaceae bacterium]|nr:hypothetical protein [Woeseiaceae bacterium]